MRITYLFSPVQLIWQEIKKKKCKYVFQKMNLPMNIKNIILSLINLDQKCYFAKFLFTFVFALLKSKKLAHYDYCHFCWYAIYFHFFTTYLHTWSHHLRNRYLLLMLVHKNCKVIKLL